MAALHHSVEHRSHQSRTVDLICLSDLSIRGHDSAQLSPARTLIAQFILMTPVGRTQAADTEGGPEMFSSDLLGLTNGVAKKQLSRARSLPTPLKLREESKRELVYQSGFYSLSGTSLQMPEAVITFHSLLPLFPYLNASSI